MRPAVPLLVVVAAAAAVLFLCWDTGAASALGSTAAPTPPARRTPTAVPAPAVTPTATVTPTPTPAFLPRLPKPDGEPADFVVRGNGETGCAALTFDMGVPDNTSTASVLDALRDNGVRSTFFVTGEWLEASPELARRMVEEGHELANHSYDHPYFTRISDERMLWQLERTDQLVREVAGVEPAPYFRPPFGAYDEKVLRVLGQAGYYVIYWSLDSNDWRPEATTDSVIRRVVDLTQPGEVVIFHGYVPKTAWALPVIIERLRKQGLCFGTVTDLLR